MYMFIYFDLMLGVTSPKCASMYSGIRKDSGAIFREKNEVNERERVKQRENELKNRNELKENELMGRNELMNRSEPNYISDWKSRN